MKQVGCNLQPLPKLLLERRSSWSDSSNSKGSNSKNTDDINYMPKPLAVREKFVFDPEHGGGRRRRCKHLPR